MKNFKEYVSEADKKETKPTVESEYAKYTKDFGEAIEKIGAIIEYGRSIEMDNKSINPLLDAIKSLHSSDDSIRKSFEKSQEPEEIPEIPKKKKDEGGW